jgi:hypothetical protein
MHSKIKQRLDEATPIANRNENGVEIPLTVEEREEWLDASATIILEEYFLDLRSVRNNLLAGSDWTQMSDAPVNAKAWAKYRQELRDLPATITDPTSPVVWPEPPK